MVQSSINCDVTLHPREEKLLQVGFHLMLQQKNCFPLSRIVKFKKLSLIMT